MKRSIQVLAVLVVATMIMVTGSAQAFGRTGTSGTSTECARCHASQAKVGAPVVSLTAPVNYSKCKTCHWMTATTAVGGYNHRHGIKTKCTKCHARYGVGPATNVMSVATAAGNFSTAGYGQLSASELHAIHVRGSWPKSGTKTAACASCHAPAACDACHVAAATHSGHAYNAASRSAQYAPVLALSTRGTTVNKVTATARVLSSTCTNSKCHVVSADGATITKPECSTCHMPLFRSFRAAPVANAKPVRVR
jgi:hypothetical protein